MDKHTRYNHSAKGRARWLRYWHRNADRLNAERNTQSRTASIEHNDASIDVLVEEYDGKVFGPFN